MKLVLQNGYPYPYPEGLSEAESDVIAGRAGGAELVLSGVTHVQWLHTVTVEFADSTAFEDARRLTGWTQWSPLVLEAPTCADEGYDHPAIITGSVAYCGFVLTDEV